MDALFGLTGPDFVVVCADKMHARSIVKMDVRSRRPPPLPRRAAPSPREMPDRSPPRKWAQHNMDKLRVLPLRLLEKK